jgi:hypothetical protein
VGSRLKKRTLLVQITYKLTFSFIDLVAGT